MSEVLDAALSYAELGWRVVPCSVEKKHPTISGWQRVATNDVDEVEELWSGGHAGDGVSIVFGPSSGVIDIDFDDPADEGKLWRAAGCDPPVTVSYLSGRRKTPHRLFRWRPDLPDKANINLRNLCGLDIDVKLGAGDKGSHSLAPPSNGYEWLPGLSPEECDLAELPDELVMWLRRQIGGPDSEAAQANGIDALGGGRSVDEILQPASEGSRNDDLASYVGLMVSNFAEVEGPTVAKLIKDQAKAKGMTYYPPLGAEECERVALSILEAERKKRQAAASVATAQLARQAQDGNNTHPTGFRLVRVLADPVYFELHHSDFETEAGGFLVLTAEEVLSGRRIATQAAAQAGHLMPDAFAKAWSRSGGLCEQLFILMTSREGPREADRAALVAQSIEQCLSHARPLGGDSGRLMDHRGRPTLFDNGDVAVGRVVLRQDVVMACRLDSVKPVIDCMERVGARRRRLHCKKPSGGESRISAWLVDCEAAQRLSEATRLDDE